MAVPDEKLALYAKLKYCNPRGSTKRLYQNDLGLVMIMFCEW